MLPIQHVSVSLPQGRSSYSFSLLLGFVFRFVLGTICIQSFSPKPYDVIRAQTLQCNGVTLHWLSKTFIRFHCLIHTDSPPVLRPHRKQCQESQRVLSGGASFHRRRRGAVATFGWTLRDQGLFRFLFGCLCLCLCLFVCLSVCLLACLCMWVCVCVCVHACVCVCVRACVSFCVCKYTCVVGFIVVVFKIICPEYSDYLHFWLTDHCIAGSWGSGVGRSTLTAVNFHQASLRDYSATRLLCAKNLNQHALFHFVQQIRDSVLWLLKSSLCLLYLFHWPPICIKFWQQLPESVKAFWELDDVIVWCSFSAFQMKLLNLYIKRSQASGGGAKPWWAGEDYHVNSLPSRCEGDPWRTPVILRCWGNRKMRFVTSGIDFKLARMVSTSCAKPFWNVLQGKGGCEH